MSRPSCQTDRALEWLYGHTPRLDVAVRRWRQDGTPQMLHPERLPRLASLERFSTERVLPWLRRENARGADIYVRPARDVGTCSIVFLDDLSPAIAMRVARKYAALATQTSRASAQVWILTDRPLDEVARAVVQRELAARIGADPGSVSGEHLGRLAGFRNRKPVHAGRPWVNLLAATSGPALQVGGILSGATAPATVHTDHLDAHHRSRDASRTGDLSAHDFATAMRAVERHADIEDCIRTIADAALDRGKRTTYAACLEYARRTVRAAAQRTHS